MPKAKKQPYRYLNLIRELAISDFKVKYQGSAVGYLWSLMKPLILFATLYIVFTKFVRIGGNIPNYSLFLLIGIVLWTYFSESTIGSMHALIGKQDLIRKIYFPRIIIVLSSSISALITFVLNFLVIFAFLFYLRIEIRPTVLLVILPLIQLYLFSLGVSFFVSALYAKFKDMLHIWELALQILFYASPILYPLELVPERFRSLVVLNPVAQIIQQVRSLFLGGEHIVTSGEILPGPLAMIPYAFTLILAVLGWFFYQKSSEMFAEEI